MSTSRSGSSSRSVRRPSKKKKADPAVAAARAPWIKNGIDYGPARAAIGELAVWALDLAERSVADWPAGRAHVCATRRLMEAHVTGTRSRAASVDDVMFTARLLARIFDEDLGLGLTDVLTIFDTLELPSEVVPVRSYAPRTPRSTSSMLHALTRSIAPMVAAQHAAIPPLLRFCDECGYVHEPGDHIRHRNAA
jgi:hypothetical protein